MEGVRRLEPGVTFEAARADLQRVTRILAERHPDENRGMSGTLVPVSEKVAGDNTRRTLWVLVGAVGALLLIACVSLTNLLLAKAAGRTREMALRAALGATRRRIVGLLVAESLLLSAAGHHQPAAGGSAVAGENPVGRRRRCLPARGWRRPWSLASCRRGRRCASMWRPRSGQSESTSGSRCRVPGSRFGSGFTVRFEVQGFLV